ncbi:MAG: bifunctional diaminohydroxyphosphoribosylaminopyrimidine deaminase/5-amino-6-(5-phosphoribosylamino)uracil reductase RibD [Chloroflexi bacterium]|nr:bifunctional diaminohydroxyphosphoribosylaminopyrimidine deaminase/5-amino-6-(5-phosphoribosylamino)uracil reductase RibD [Chloroflexota bacterium]
MARALALADRVRGRTSPNPAVGAVVVRDGEIVGEGATQPPGLKHAEIVALEQARDRARGATFYVTLEPCCHFGRTGPCTEAIIVAGVAEVRAATIDPFPLVRGRGFQALEAAGIRVVVGERAEEARSLNAGFAKHVATGLPHVIAKWAMTLDGKIATVGGDSRWVSGEDARAVVHELRDRVDAVIVGVNTVIADDPRLTARRAAETDHRSLRLNAPLRVVVDSRARVPPASALLAPDLARGTVIAVSDAAPLDRRAALAATGAAVVVLPADAGRVDVVALLRWLGNAGVLNVLVEGGGELLASFFRRDLIDEVYAFVAPKVVGGRAPTPVGGDGVERMAQARPLEITCVQRVGQDLLVVGRPGSLSEARDYWG